MKFCKDKVCFALISKHNNCVTPDTKAYDTPEEEKIKYYKIPKYPDSHTVIFSSNNRSSCYKTHHWSYFKLEISFRKPF